MRETDFPIYPHTQPSYAAAVGSVALLLVALVVVVLIAFSVLLPASANLKKQRIGDIIAKK
jgi:hypothetical protein